MRLTTATRQKPMQQQPFSMRPGLKKPTTRGPGQRHNKRTTLLPSWLWLMCVLAVFANLPFAKPVAAETELSGNTTLLMVEEDGCPYCAKFNREIAHIYPKTEEGKTAPLQRIDLHKSWPSSLDHIDRPRFTPTFILVHDNREIGRLIGYNGDEYFWFLLGELLQQVEPASTDSPAASGDSASSESPAVSGDSKA
jgi:hypothetical protein